VNDLYKFFSTNGQGAGPSFDIGNAIQSENGATNDLGRFKRSGDFGGHHGHHSGHHGHRSQRRRNVEEPPAPLQDAIVYPEDKLSPWMRGLIGSVESASAVLEPALRTIGFEPNETLEVSVIQRATIATPTTKTVTALEFAEHITTKGHAGYSFSPKTDRGRELQSIITDSEKYGHEGFFSKAGLHPIRQKFRHEGLEAIGDKLSKFGVFLDYHATLYRVEANPPLERGRRPTWDRSINAEIGNLIRVGGTINKYFAIIPHHPDLVIPTPDPNSADEWNQWMRETGKFLLFRDPSKLPRRTRFLAVQEDPGNIEHPSHSVRGTVLHTLKPIVAETVKHLSDLVVKETVFERIVDYFNSFFIPIYDVAKAIVEEQHAKLIVLLGLELIPYVGEGGKVVFKASVKNPAVRTAAGQVAQVAGRLVKNGKDFVAPAVIDSVADEISSRSA
jgi:hypothetical protein